MRADRHDPIAIPLGHVEQPRPDWRGLDVPTILRQRERMEWSDCPPEYRAAAREAAKRVLRERYGETAESTCDAIDRSWR